MSPLQMKLYQVRWHNTCGVKTSYHCGLSLSLPYYVFRLQEYLDRFVFGTEQVPGAKFQRSGGRLFQDFQV